MLTLSNPISPLGRVSADFDALDAFTTWIRKGTAFTLRAQAAYDNRTGEMLVPVGIGLTFTRRFAE